jgi:protein SFI1
MHGQSLLKKCLNEMKSTQLSRRDLEMEATAFFEDRATTSCMKKWSRIHLQLRARQHVVFEVREKCIKKTSRRILAHWRQRAFQKQDLGVRGSMERSNSSFREKAAPWTQLGDDRIVDDWTDGNDEAAISTTIPGYLSTPSKKMSRVSTMTKLPSTTPSAPLSTPVERQLRAQYSGGVLPSFRRRIGRSLLGREGTALDLDEESKTRDGEVDIE